MFAGAGNINHDPNILKNCTNISLTHFEAAGTFPGWDAMVIVSVDEGDSRPAYIGPCLAEREYAGASDRWEEV